MSGQRPAPSRRRSTLPSGAPRALWRPRWRWIKAALKRGANWRRCYSNVPRWLRWSSGDEDSSRHVASLDAVDTSGEHRQRWRQPGSLSVRTVPSDAKIQHPTSSDRRRNPVLHQSVLVRPCRARLRARVASRLLQAAYRKSRKRRYAVPVRGEEGRDHLGPHPPPVAWGHPDRLHFRACRAVPLRGPRRGVATVVSQCCAGSRAATGRVPDQETRDDVRENGSSSCRACRPRSALRGCQRSRRFRARLRSPKPAMATGNCSSRFPTGR